MKKDNIKYTTDGRKVVVIGDLNQTEKIVQEIFVTEDGAEIPSGERFTAKSLHDTPVKSWKEENLLKLEAKYEKESEYWEKKINDIKNEKSFFYKSLSLRVKWLKQVAKQPHPESLKKVIETLAMFLSNTDMWVFYSNYSTWYLEKYDQEGFSRIHDQVDGDYYGTKLDYMKLVSIYGKTDGNFEFRINQYSDGSGNNKTVEYFKSKEDALKYIQKRFDLIEVYDSKYLSIAHKLDLRIDKDKLKAYKDSQKEFVFERIDEAKKTLLSYQNQLKDLD